MSSFSGARKSSAGGIASASLLAYRDDERNPVVESFLNSLDPELAPLDRAIHREDEMLRFEVRTYRGDRDLGLFGYFRSGFLAWEVSRPLLAATQAIHHHPIRVLDFASGYGRLTRFLVRALAPEQVWIGELDPMAVAFQRERFGVNALDPAKLPQDLVTDLRFDCILVHSLFSHLPREPFEAWLAALYRLLAPGGVLAFSVFDQRQRWPGSRSVLRKVGPSEQEPGEEEPGEDGFFYEPIDASPLLSPDSYGTTWVSDRYLAQTLQKIAGRAVTYRRLPRGLWHHQDLILVARQPAPDLSGLGFDKAPEGHLEICRRQPDGKLALSGWAWVDAEELVLEVRLNGQLVAQPEPHHKRPDVAQHLGLEEPPRAGWDGIVAAGWRPQDLLRIDAVADSSRRYALHLSSVRSASRWVERRRRPGRAVTRGLEGRLRNLWRRLRRRAMDHRAR